MTNNLEATESIFDKADYEMMLILGVARTVKRELRKLHTTFGSFGLFHLPTEQLICRLNMLLQHYHASTALSKKLDESFKYLQLHNEDLFLHHCNNKTCPHLALHQQRYCHHHSRHLT